MKGCRGRERGTMIVLSKYGYIFNNSSAKIELLVTIPFQVCHFFSNFSAKIGITEKPTRCAREIRSSTARNQFRSSTIGDFFNLKFKD